MAPGNNERRPNHTGTIPKTKVRNNCNVPQEVVTPTRRDNATNMVSTSLDWVPVSEYNSRGNHNQSRKPTNNSSDHEFADLDHAASFESSGFGRFVPVRPQPRALPLSVQNCENLTSEHNDDGAGSSLSGHSLHSYGHQMQNGVIPHSNHAAAAVMVVNPTTPNALTGNITQPYNAPTQNRNNLTRNLHPTRNNLEGSSHSSHNNSTQSLSNTRGGTKTVNLINNMYEQTQGGFNNINENHISRESARVLGEAIVAACPDAAAVERRLGQIREYIRVTSSLVDTMRNSEDEAFIEHTKEEYDELVEMVMQLKESEAKLVKMLEDNPPDNVEVPLEEENENKTEPAQKLSEAQKTEVEGDRDKADISTVAAQNIVNPAITKENDDNKSVIINVNKIINNDLNKITNIQNEQNNTQSKVTNLPLSNENENNTVNKQNSTSNKVSNISNEQGNINTKVTNVKEDKTILHNEETNTCGKCSILPSNEIKESNIQNEQSINILKEVMKPPHKEQNDTFLESESAGTSDVREKKVTEISSPPETPIVKSPSSLSAHLEKILEDEEENRVEINEIEITSNEIEIARKDDDYLNDLLRKNILSCVEKITLMEELKKSKSFDKPYNGIQQDIVVRPVSVQSNGSAYSENELWQSEIKDKMEMSQLRLTALKQQQKRLLKYQEEAKQQLEEMHRERERESQEIHSSTSHDNYVNLQGHYPHRMYAANQIGVATTLPHSSENISQPVVTSNMESDHARAHSSRSHEEYVRDTNQEAASRDGRAADSEPEEEILSDRARVIQHKLRELQMKKQHVEKLVTEFQKLQRATQMGASLNNYSSSGEESGDDEQMPKSNKPCSNLKNEDPFKLMEIKAIKAALEKTKDLMRTVESYESDRLSNAGHEDFHAASHSNIHDNKSDGGASGGGWSSVYEATAPRNRQKFTNENQQGHEANIASLQELAQELRMETEKIMSERTRIKDLVSNKAEGSRRQKKVNEEAAAVPSTSSGTSMGPAERRQLQLRALLAEKQRELEALLNKEEVPGPSATTQLAARSASQPASVINQSYNSEQDEPDSRSEQLLLDSQNSREIEAFRTGVDNGLGVRSNTIPSHLGSAFGSDSDSASRTKSNQRNRSRRRPAPERQPDDNTTQTINPNVNVMRHEPQSQESSNVNMVSPTAVQNNDNPNVMPYPYPPQNWNKTNQDIRTNQFTQNSHSQTMERLMGTPQMFAPPAPPSVPFNMMMPYGMVGGCGCGCGVWGAWCWQQLALQQREIHQLREQLNHLEERWRAETASHTLNNQVPPGNRANNYWDNFRSYSRQNLLSANSKTNADGHLGASVVHNPQPLVERSHNTLHHTMSSSSNTPKRNTDSSQTINEEFPNRQRRNVAYERSHSFSSAPDVLNVNQNTETDASTSTHNRNADENVVTNVNINRQDRNLNITNPIPEIIQSHSNNLKKKSSSKLPAKNSTNRRNYSLGYVETCNINIASTSESPNPNLVSTSREHNDKATQKVFEQTRDNVYSEVTNLIGANESHPDFLIQLFRELQLISSDSLRQRVLQSIRNVLGQYDLIIDSQSNEITEASRPEVVTTSADISNYHDCNLTSGQNCTSTVQIDNGIVRFLLLKSEEICTPDLLEILASHILNSTGQVKSPQQLKRLRDMLAKYEGMRVCDVSSDIIDNLPLITSNNEGDESTQHTSELSDSSILQDVAGSLNMFSSSDSHLHQVNSYPFELWQRHVHEDNEITNSARSSQDGKVDLINCSEMHNADLAEADQTHSENDQEEGAGASVDALPDVVDTEEATPTEAEAEWLGLDRVPTRLHLGEPSAKQKD